MAGVFISYRRDDARGDAGRLHADLARRFGADRVFMDITAIEPGVPFATALDRAVTTCDVFLAVIEPRWLSIADESGRRRLDDPADHMRREVATALVREDIRVIPVLVGGAAMPAAAALPEPLKALRERNAFSLRDDIWDYDVERLVEVLERLVALPEVPASPEQPPSSTAPNQVRTMARPRRHPGG